MSIETLVKNVLERRYRLTSKDTEILVEKLLSSLIFGYNEKGRPQELNKARYFRQSNYKVTWNNDLPEQLERTLHQGLVSRKGSQ